MKRLGWIAVASLNFAARKLRLKEGVLYLGGIITSRIVSIFLCVGYILVVYRSTDTKVAFIMLPVLMYAILRLATPGKRSSRLFFTSYVAIKSGQVAGFGNFFVRLDSTGMTVGQMERISDERSISLGVDKITILGVIKLPDRGKNLSGNNILIDRMTQGEKKYYFI